MFEIGLAMLCITGAVWLIVTIRGTRAEDHLVEDLLDGADPSILERVGRSGRKQALEQTIASAETVDPAWVIALAELEPKAGFAHVTYLREQGEHRAIAKVCNAVLKANRKHVAAADTLVRARLDLGETQKAAKLLDQLPKSEPLFQLLRAELMLAHDRIEDATPIVMGVLEKARMQGQLTVLEGSNVYWDGVRSRAEALRNRMLQEVSADDSEVFYAEARSGRLERRSGVNHTLAGQHAMARSRRIASELHLLPPDMESTHPLRQAEAELRVGSPSLARKLFERMVDEDPSYFPGQLGLGAALLRAESRSDQLIERWRHLDLHPDWWDVLPDLPALSADERAVVAASIGPLALVREAMTAAGARVFVLPLDVRPTDRPELAALEGHRHTDGRSYDGIGGIAQRSAAGAVAFARIESLLAPGADRTFAHEFAHLAFWHLDEATQQEVLDLYQAAREVEWAWTAYQSQDVDEFFAVSYEDWLGERWGIVAPRPDSSGWWTRIIDFFQRLSDRSEWDDVARL